MNNEYPNEIDLGHKVPDWGAVEAASPTSKTPTKKKTVFPTLYISDVPGLAALPKEGYALIYYRRKSLNLRENHEGDEETGAELEVQELCLPKVSEEEQKKDLESAFSDFAKKKGVSTDHEEPDGDEENDEYEEGDEE